MDTTLYKIDATVNSPINLKYWVLDIDADGENTTRINVNVANLYNHDIYKTLAIFTYNDELSSISYGGGIGNPANKLINTTTVGEDTIYEYRFEIPLNKDQYTASNCGFFIIAKKNCTKILIEDVEGVNVGFVCNSSGNMSKETILMHYDNAEWETPSKFYSGQYSADFAIYNSLQLEGIKIKFDISDFEDLYQYMSYIYINKNSGITGDISVLAENINITTPMNSPYTCYGLRIYLTGNSGVNGDLTAFINTLLDRGARNLAGQIYYGGITNMFNNPSGYANQVLFYIDNDGNITYYSSLAILKENLPTT